jgi:putative methyltransferase (TIGR04325 family)
VGFIEIAERTIDKSWSMPVVGRLLELDYDRTFAHCPSGRFRGVYRSFAEAEQAAPKTRPLGYDHAALAGLYRQRMSKACESDYGPLFWLRPLIDENAVVFDFGGHVGVSYHGWRNYLGYPAGKYPSGLRWVVYDLPAITAVGEQLAGERDSDGLSFTNDLRDAHDATVFLGLGSLQYLNESLPDMLRRIGHLPSHLILNKLPLHDGESFVTVQATGAAFHPYRIFNRREFIDTVCALGYRLVDDWVSGETRCKVPFTPHNIEAYSGCYFTRVG